jgi:O-antigen ligase
MRGCHGWKSFGDVRQAPTSTHVREDRIDDPASREQQGDQPGYAADHATTLHGLPLAIRCIQNLSARLAIYRRNRYDRLASHTDDPHKFMTRNSQIIAVFVVFVAVATGFFVTEVPYAYMVAVVGLIALVAAGVWMRKRVKRVQIETLLVYGALPDDGRFRTPRQFFYLGLLSSCWLVVRVHGVTISDALFLVALVLVIVEQTTGHYKSKSILTSWIWIGIGLFVAGGALSTIVNSQDMLSSFGIVARVFYLIAAWLWTGGMVLRNRTQLWKALGYWVISAAVCGVWAVGQKFGHLPGGINAGRLAGLTEQVNDLGALTACAIVPALALAYKRRIWIFAVGGITAGLVLSGSIGAGLAALAALAFGLAARELARPTMVALGVGAVILILASPLIGSSAIARFSTSTNSNAKDNQDTFTSRVRTYELAWQRIRTEPFLGTGLDIPSSRVYDEKNQAYYQVHNLFLGLWYESGLLGIAGILILVGTLWKLGWHEVKMSSDRYLALALFAGFIAYIGAEMSEPSLYKRYSLVPAMLILALRRFSWPTLSPIDRELLEGQFTTDTKILDTVIAPREPLQI